MRASLVPAILLLLCVSPLTAQSLTTPARRWTGGVVAYGGPGLLLGLELGRQLIALGPVRFTAELGVLTEVGGHSDLACQQTFACSNIPAPLASTLAASSLTASLGATGEQGGWFALATVGAAAVSWEQSPINARGGASLLGGGVGWALRRAAGRSRLEVRFTRLTDAATHIDGARVSFSRAW